MTIDPIVLTELSVNSPIYPSVLNGNFDELKDGIDARYTAVTTDIEGVQGDIAGINSTLSTLGETVSGIFNQIYPVGSVYITTSTSDTCPVASLITGSTWVRVAANRVLQGGSSASDTTREIAAGLPNIKGAISFEGIDGGATATQVFARTLAKGAGNDHHSDQSNCKVTFDFNAGKRSSSIYSNSVSTVQPSAYTVNIWRRTA